MSSQLQISELVAGIAYWRGRTTWPVDFHNAQYQRWSAQNPRGKFTDQWWKPFLSTLVAWKAVRPQSPTQLTSRFSQLAKGLGATWQSACAPYMGQDITSVTWEQVGDFPTKVAAIKPVKGGSPVFPSKFCHFLLPKVYPVVDTSAMGNGWQTYESYFRFVQGEWGATPLDFQKELLALLDGEIAAAGSPAFTDFPFVNKIVELCVIGRQHPYTPPSPPRSSPPG